MNKMKKSMGLLFPAMRISIALALLSACVLLTADMLGYTLDEDALALENRKQIAESLAIQFSVMEPRKDIDKIEDMIRLIAQRNPLILSAGIRHESGHVIFESSEHRRLWEGYDEENSTSSHILVPLFDRDRLWGNVELRFDELMGSTLIGFTQTEVFRLIIFSILVGFFVYLVFMLRTLRQIDPSAVIPDRVNAAFDTLSEGVMIIDEGEQILLTNRAFSDRIGRDVVVLLGSKASEMKWKKASRKAATETLPWVEALATARPVIGAQFELETDSGEIIKYAINASPVLSPEGKAQGVLVTLDDITTVEEQNVQLQTMVHRLEETQAKVQEQNKELTFLATRDALTGCLNRRAFSDRFKLLFDSAREDRGDLVCIMVDLDHFKQVNDNFGHSVGDEVIIMLAEVLKANTRKEDLVGRYGGEEFCVILPGMSLDQATTVAERIRLRIKDESSKRYENGPRVTASIGLACMRDNPEDPGALNIFADEALYCAKENGRNRVVTYDAIAEIESSSPKPELEPEAEKPVVEPKIEKLQNRIAELEDIATQFSSELEYNKSYDQLTGLPNQALFYDRISQGIERGLRLALSPLDIAEAFRRCVERGAAEVIVFPYFLSPGRHWNQDIPELTA